MDKKSVVLVISLIFVISVIAGSVFYIFYNYAYGGCAIMNPPSPNIDFLLESEFEKGNGTGLYTMELATGPNLANHDDDCDPELIKIDKIRVSLLELDRTTYYYAELYHIDVNQGRFSSDDCDYKDALANHSSNILKDNGTLFPVHFVNSIDDSLGEGIPHAFEPDCLVKTYLSKGDKFVVYGSGSEADGPASGGWTIKFTISYASGSQLGPEFVLPE